MKVPRTPAHAAKTTQVPASKTSAPVGMTSPNHKAASSALAGLSDLVPSCLKRLGWFISPDHKLDYFNCFRRVSKLKASQRLYL